MSFKKAIAHVLKHEGGFVDHPKDPGGATNLGITLKTLRAWRKQHSDIDDIKNLTYNEAKDIYRANYWDKCRCGEMPAGVALMVFDGAVNHGPSQSTKFLQRALRVSADGAIGPITLTAANNTNSKKLLLEVAAQRMRFYGNLDSFKHFGKGWSRRLMSTLSEALEAEEE
ncbi:MAG: glycoside hydrolase family 108 protein [Acinetobacter sp.]|nr:glycoside hydrolase family 108 protein [Acinetobacter sp.]